MMFVDFLKALCARSGEGEDEAGETLFTNKNFCPQDDSGTWLKICDLLLGGSGKENGFYLPKTRTSEHGLDHLPSETPFMYSAESNCISFWWPKGADKCIKVAIEKSVESAGICSRELGITSVQSETMSVLFRNIDSDVDDTFTDDTNKVSVDNYIRLLSRLFKTFEEMCPVFTALIMSQYWVDKEDPASIWTRDGADEPTDGMLICWASFLAYHGYVIFQPVCKFAFPGLICSLDGAPGSGKSKIHDILTERLIPERSVFLLPKSEPDKFYWSGALTRPVQQLDTSFDWYLWLRAPDRCSEFGTPIGNTMACFGDDRAKINVEYKMEKPIQTYLSASCLATGNGLPPNTKSEEEDKAKDLESGAPNALRLKAVADKGDIHFARRYLFPAPFNYPMNTSEKPQKYYKSLGSTDGKPSPTDLEMIYVMNCMRVLFNLFFVRKLQVVDEEEGNTLSVKDFSDTCSLRNQLDEVWSKLTCTEERSKLGKFIQRDPTQASFAKSGNKFLKAFYGISDASLKTIPQMDRSFKDICRVLQIKETKAQVCTSCWLCFTATTPQAKMDSLPRKLPCPGSDDGKHCIPINPETGKPKATRIIRGYRIPGLSPDIPGTVIGSGL